jgi:hypothetical protein
MVATQLRKSIIQLRDWPMNDTLGFMQESAEENTMVIETKDRFVNTDAKIENDGVKRQPHERDESPDGQDQEPRGIMKQAAEDLAQGLVDTDLRNTPGISEAVEPGAGATGQANPQPDRHRSMRDHDSVEPVPGKNR